MTTEHKPQNVPRKLTEIVADRMNVNANRAAECLRALDLLSGDDLARDDYRAAAQTFALLAVVDALMNGSRGASVADCVLIAGGVQP